MAETERGIRTAWPCSPHIEAQFSPCGEPCMAKVGQCNKCTWRLLLQRHELLCGWEGSEDGKNLGLWGLHQGEVFSLRDMRVTTAGHCHKCTWRRVCGWEGSGKHPPLQAEEH